MEARVRRLINVVWGLLLLLVVADHFTGTSYRLLLRKFVRADISLYIEITSMIFTMGVPFFYSLYKRRENQLEEQALREGGSVAELEAARGRNDFRCILYYSLMAGFVVLLLFVQSSIINASKAETANLEHQIASMRQSLQVSNEQIREMNGRLERLESILRSMAAQDQRTMAALREIAEIRSITESIDSMMTTARSATAVPDRGTVELGELTRQVQRLDERLAALEEAVSGSLVKTTESLARNMEKVAELMSQIRASMRADIGGVPVSKRGQQGSSLLSDADKQRIRQLVAKYVQDFEAATGKLGSPDEAKADKVRSRFQNFLRRQGEDLDSFKAEVGKSEYIIRRALEECNKGNYMGFTNCRDKLQWLLILLRL